MPFLAGEKRLVLALRTRRATRYIPSHLTLHTITYHLAYAPMLLKTIQVAALATLATAEYTQFHFTPNGSCSDIYFDCSPPLNACAYDSVTDRHYCCSGSSYNVCRTSPDECGGSDGNASSSQRSCESGSASWCCRSDSFERCTVRTGRAIT
jgi:hypothetical protein